MAERDVLVMTPPDRYSRPPGDPGWFGPTSVTWQVHADLASMLVGGMSALLLQTLHPLVMQGVADHSNYRHDPHGRLQRTAEFIAGTTFGSDELAWRLVRRVQAVHSRVHGYFGDQPYDASDPDLVAYVHVTEVWSFLRSYQRYGGHPLLKSEKDRYLDEMSVVGERLGAGPLPRSTEEVRAYLRAIRPQLWPTKEAFEAVDFLIAAPPGASVTRRAANATIWEAAIDLLPPFARRMLGLTRPSFVRLGVVRPSAVALTSLIRFASGDSPTLAAARRRVAA